MHRNRWPAGSCRCLAAVTYPIQTCRLTDLRFSMRKAWDGPTISRDSWQHLLPQKLDHGDYTHIVLQSKRSPGSCGCFKRCDTTGGLSIYP